MERANFEKNSSIINPLLIVGAMGTLLFGSNEAQGLTTPNCPAVEAIDTKITPECKLDLITVLRNGPYDDVIDSLAIGTYQKIAGNDLIVDSDLGPKTAKSILLDIGLSPPLPDKKTIGHKVVVDKNNQVMYDVKNNKIRHIFSISTGTEAPYPATIDPKTKKVKAPAGIGDTPTGRFKVNYETGAKEEGPLGIMPYAHYYRVGGFAVHAGFVTLEGRLSHGCVRVQSDTMLKYVNPELKIGDAVIIKEKV